MLMLMLQYLCTCWCTLGHCYTEHNACPPPLAASKTTVPPPHPLPLGAASASAPPAAAAAAAVCPDLRVLPWQLRHTQSIMHAPPPHPSIGASNATVTPPLTPCRQVCCCCCRTHGPAVAPLAIVT
jgi:hypothetical protein